ncbi:DNA cytosine methyltransferase [Nonomuraea endophytica]|uniref:DNA (cytosine-5-)-methyltransferase n=1 Tax=Nonomuraea endophytica TaxID=714136 RepID=A0A7W8EEQ3_9ACTN|nr:DNA cytosine methyltransferase [Nonomuraea endophytica]MBB5075657.1 DNA (cytosine-5)-methyltransferase 1 [Nonomuraea endophytica]
MTSGTSSPYRIIDLFAGPGGLDVAATWLGLPVIGIEIDDNACRTRKKAGLRTNPGDVRDFGPKDFPDENVLAGGPPCQTYTVAGSGTGRQALDKVLAFARRMDEGEDVRTELARMPDVRTGLVLEPLRWALEAIDLDRPYEVIVLEQVPAVLPIWDAMAKILRTRGYGVATGVLRTEQFGVPQTRRRAVLIARWGTTEVALPQPTHRAFNKRVAREQGDLMLKPWVPMGEVVRGGQTFTVVSNYGTGGDPKARGKRTHAEPSATVTGKISRNRIEGDGSRWGWHEAGQLQTFPSDYPWDGGDISQQIGNAVPPLLALHILEAALQLGTDLERWSAVCLPPWTKALRGVSH